MTDFQLTYEQGILLDNDSQYDIHTTNTVLKKFSSNIILMFCMTTLSSTNIPNVASDFVIEHPAPHVEMVESPIFGSLACYLNTQKNRDSIEDHLSAIAAYPDSWWKKYEADRPSTATFYNVRKFLDVNTNDTLLKDAEVMPKRNATLLLEWHNQSFICSVNIASNEFSYSILLDNATPLMGQAPIEDQEAIKLFFHQLTSVINV